MGEYIKLNDSWTEVLNVYKKINNVWVEQTNLSSCMDQSSIYLYNSEQIDIVISFEIYAPDTYTGKSLLLNALYDESVVYPSWAITSGNTYASINSNGKITIEEGTENESITIQATYNNKITTKTIVISYDNELLIDCFNIIDDGVQYYVIRGTSGNVIAKYNSTIVTPTWAIISGNEYATIDNDGVVTVIDSGTIIVQAIYNNYTTTREIYVIYNANITSETKVGEDGSTTTEITTISTDSSGNVKKDITGVITHEDGSVSNTHQEIVEFQSGAVSSSLETYNSDGTSEIEMSSVYSPDENGSVYSEYSKVNLDENGDTINLTSIKSTANSDGSSNSVTTNYDGDGNPTSQINNEIDTSGNSSTQDVEYDANGTPIITGYSIDTSNNSEGTKEFNSDGVNTEFYGFDATRGFILNFHFIIDLNNQPPNQNDGHNNILTMKRADPKPWYGFQVRHSGTNGYIVFGTQFATGGNTNTNMAVNNANKVNGQSKVLEYDLTITYNPFASTKSFVCTDSISNTTILSSNGVFPDIQELRYLTICIGYAQDSSGNAYRFSNIDVLNFSVTKLNL